MYCRCNNLSSLYLDFIHEWLGNPFIRLKIAPEHILCKTSSKLYPFLMLDVVGGCGGRWIGWCKKGKCWLEMDDGRVCVQGGFFVVVMIGVQEMAWFGCAGKPSKKVQQRRKICVIFPRVSLPSLARVSTVLESTTVYYIMRNECQQSGLVHVHLLVIPI